MNLLHPTTLPACFVFTVATQILNLKWISKFWHFSFHGVCYWMILCWFESAWIRLFYFTSKSVNFFYCRFLITFKRFLVLIDYSKGTDWKQLLLLEMSECFSRWAALVGVANFEWPLLTRGYSRKFYTGRLLPEVQPLTLLYSNFDWKGTPFVDLLLTNGIPFTYLF